MESIISLALDPVRQQFAASDGKLALAIEIAMPPLSTERAHDRAFRASSKSTQEAVNMWPNDRILALFDISPAHNSGTHGRIRVIRHGRGRFGTRRLPGASAAREHAGDDSST
jgi:hypothetical protein